MKKTLVIFAVILLAVGAGFFYLWRKGLLSAIPVSQKPKMYVIGVVRTPPTLDAIWEGFRVKMRGLGYEEGKSVTYKVTEVGGDAAETKKKVAILIDQHPDLIYPLGGFAVRAAKEITEERGLSIPVVFGIAADPVRGKLVRDLKSSGNNLTGVVSANEVVSSKRLELFLEVAPRVKRIIFPWNDPVTTGIETFRQTARTLGLVLVEQHVSNVDELDAFLSSFAFRPNDGLFRASDNLIAQRVEEMARFALRKKVPFSGTNIFDVEHGALMSYGANFKKMGEQAAVLVDKILAGGKAPSDLPIELPAEFDLVVNVTTARALGITISPEFLAKATRIVR